jgi:hypothetical protein
VFCRRANEKLQRTLFDVPHCAAVLRALGWTEVSLFASESNPLRDRIRSLHPSHVCAVSAVQHW